jgi:hypothetical protein
MTDDKMIRLVDALNVPFPPDWRDRAIGFQGGLKMQAAWRDGFYACLNTIEALNTGKEPMRETRFAQCDIFEEEPSHE